MPTAARHRIRMWVSRSGKFADIYMWLDPRIRPRRVTRRSDLVMDGVARSANSYAYFALRRSNGDSLSVSHNLHTPRLIERGVKFGLPTIVLIREPSAVLASAMQFDEGGTPRHIIDAYSTYYRTVEPLLDRVVLADFTEVIADFGAVIRRCNARFGTDFIPYERTDDGEKAIRETIDELMAQTFSPDDVVAKTPRPSDRRRTVDDVLAELDSVDQHRLAEAEQLYASIRSAALHR